MVKNLGFVGLRVDFPYFFQYGQASEAKYLGKINSDSDDAANSSKAYETAENSVIDKRIK